MLTPHSQNYDSANYSATSERRSLEWQDALVSVCADPLDKPPRPAKRGFVIHAAPGVTLAQDLARRDFTITSIANY